MLILSKAQKLAEHALNEWRRWQAPFHSQPKIVALLEGGLTNTSYLIESGSQRAVLRINNPEADKLGVNRHTEITVLEKLQSTKLVPTTYFADSNYLVSEYINGVVLDDDKASDPSIKKQIEQAIALIQNQHFVDLEVRNYEAYLREYCNQLGALYLDKSIRQSLLQMARNIDSQDWQPVLCHHDLIPENIIMSSRGLIIIDWEYASMGHPQFDYLRLINNQHIRDIPSNMCNLEALQATLVQLWYAIRYPELRETVQHKLIKIIETVQASS
jgi:thiamine kinase